MVITKTPFRISFFGGGTDYPSWYEANGGAVLSTTINKYCYITCRHLPPFFDFNYKIRAHETQHAKTIAEINHPSVRACLTYADTAERIEMQHNADLPAMSGLGSSSSFTVGFLKALYALQGKDASKEQLAADAIHVEQDVLKENVGSQDQIAAAFGGLNLIKFGGPEKFSVTPVAMTAEKTKVLEDHLLFFFTGFARTASEIAAEQIKNTKAKAKDSELRAIAAMVPEAVKILNGSPAQLADFGKLLDESWQLKKSLSSQITNSHIDDMYAAAREAGAIGGKIVGAGGGGFMLVFAKPEMHAAIKQKLGKFLNVPFHFETAGSQIIYQAPNEIYLS